MAGSMRVLLWTLVSFYSLQRCSRSVAQSFCRVWLHGQLPSYSRLCWGLITELYTGARSLRSLSRCIPVLENTAAT